RALSAGGHAFADKLGDCVLKFFSLMHSADFHLAHQCVRKIKRCFHKARFPESWFSVNSLVDLHCFGAITFCTNASKRGSPSNELSRGSTLITPISSPSRSA